jgi:hypothetical protein
MATYYIIKNGKSLLCKMQENAGHIVSKESQK